MNITQENRDKKRIFQGKRETRRQSVSETELWPCPACNINQEVFLFQKKPHTPQYKLKGNSKVKTSHFTRLLDILGIFPNTLQVKFAKFNTFVFRKGFTIYIFVF